MSFYAYRATAFSYTHENKAFDRLYDLLKNKWAESDEPLHLLGNFYVDGCEIDALIIKRNAIIVIDFKDYGGVLSFSENGRWRIDGHEVRGGNKTNPFQQIRDNKYSLLNYLRSCDFRSEPNLGHIAGLCLFHQPIQFDVNQLPHNISRWFHIVEMEKAIRMLDAIVSPAISLPEADIHMLIELLDVPPYFPDGHAIEMPFGVIEAEAEIETPLNIEQSKAIIAIEDWLESTKVKVFSLAGAFYTGKSKLLKATVKRIIQHDKSPVYLAPNARIANLYKQRGFTDTQSIYSWLYTSNPSEIKNGKAYYSVNLDPVDSEKEVLIFLDSHLLGDEHFETDTIIYGSGFILQDLLNTLLGQVIDADSAQSSIELKALPKFLLVGDPYQLTRGARDRSLLRCQIFEQRNIQYEYNELNAQDRDKEAPIERLDFQKTLIEQIKGKRFTLLPICEQGEIKTINKGEHTSQIAQNLLKWPRKSVYLCAKNDTAHSVNTAIRSKYLNADNTRLLVVGDIVDLHNRTPKLSTNQFEGADGEWINAGNFGLVVSVNNEIETKSLILKGRDTPVLINFATAEIKFGSDVTEVRYLPDFLSAPKPELIPDHVLALQIWARKDADQKLLNEKALLDKQKDVNEERYKADLQVYRQKHNALIMCSPFLNAARLRFGYSLTVHRAQAYEPMPEVILDGHSAHDTENPATASYFRWLYTASVCTSETLHILDYPILTPLSKARWSFSSARIVPINFKPALYYQQKRIPTNEELDVPLPNGFSNPEPRLVSLLLTVYDLINKSSWHVDTITQHNYKDRYLFVSDDGSVELDLNYNGKYEVSIGIANVIEGSSELANQIKRQLYTAPIYNDSNIEAAVMLFNGHIARHGWSIISVDEKNYKAFVIADSKIGRVKLELNIPSDTSVSKKGVISSIKVQQADSTEVLSVFEENFAYD